MRQRQGHGDSSGRIGRLQPRALHRRQAKFDDVPLRAQQIRCPFGIVAGIEAGLHTVLVLSGIADRAEIARYPFRPKLVIDAVADLLDYLS